VRQREREVHQSLDRPVLDLPAEGDRGEVRPGGPQALLSGEGGHTNSFRRATTARAAMFTINVITKRTRPEAMSAPRPVAVASAKLFAMFEANVEPPFSRMCQLILGTNVSTIATEYVPPLARTMPDIVAHIQL